MPYVCHFGRGLVVRVAPPRSRLYCACPPPALIRPLCPACLPCRALFCVFGWVGCNRYAPPCLVSAPRRPSARGKPYPRRKVASAGGGRQGVPLRKIRFGGHKAGRGGGVSEVYFSRKGLARQGRQAGRAGQRAGRRRRLRGGA